MKIICNFVELLLTRCLDWFYFGIYVLMSELGKKNISVLYFWEQNISLKSSIMGELIDMGAI